MRTILLAATILAGAAGLSADDGPTRPSTDAAAAFARMKTLAGEWQADTETGKARLSYELTAGGSALVERETAEKMPPMLTVYHLDGARLILTHYCAAGNQPRMAAERYDGGRGVVEFKFLDATGMASPAAGHMHNAALRFIDDDHLESQWQFFENGRLKFTEKIQFTRIR
jgi:hypothetical protein